MRTIAIALVLAGAGDNELSEQEKKDGWILLWNGKDSEGWIDGAGAALKSESLAEGINPLGAKGGMAYTKERFGNFVLACDFKVSKGCNSGVYYRPGQVEYQVLDNVDSPYGQNPRTSAASLYFCMAPSKDATRPVGECRFDATSIW